MHMKQTKIKKKSKLAANSSYPYRIFIIGGFGSRKTAEGTGDLIGDKIDDKITKVSKTSPQSNLEATTN